MKRKSPGRLKSELWNKLRPEVDPNTLVNEIADLLHKQLGESARGVNVVHNLVQYLTQKYSVSDRKTGKLRWLIEGHPENLAAFLDQISFKDFRSLTIVADRLPRTKKSLELKREQRPKQRNGERKPKTGMSRADAYTARD